MATKEVRPVRAEDIAWLMSRYSKLRTEGRGGIAILRGPHGSGRSLLAREFAARVTSTATVVGATMVEGIDGRHRLVGWEANGSAPPAAFDAAVEALSLSGTLIPTLGFVGQLMKTGQAARALAQQLGQQRLLEQPLSLIPRLLEAVARGGDCVCIVDDADLADGLLRDLELALAHSIQRDLRAMVVLVLGDPSEQRVGNSDATLLAENLVARGLASLRELRPFERPDLAEWLGPAAREVLDDLLELTWGRAGLIAEVWTEWLRTETVTQSNGYWVYSDAAEQVGVSGAEDAVIAHLRSSTEGLPASIVIDVRRILSCAALEGRVFTADAVAAALGLDRDAVLAVLDDVLSVPTDDGWAILDKGQSVQALRPVWPYRFRSVWHWLGFRDQGRAEAGLSEAVAEAVKDLYGPESPRLRSLIGQPDAWEDANDSLRRANAIISADTEPWDAWECSRAAQVLVDAYGFGITMLSVDDVARLLEAALALAERGTNGRLQCLVHIYRHDLWSIHGGPIDGDYELRAAEQIARDLSFSLGLGTIRLRRADREVDSGKKHALLWRALDDLRSAGEREQQAYAHQQLALLADGMDSPEDAAGHLIRAVQLWDDHPHRHVQLQLMTALTHLGRIEFRLDRRAMAAEHCAAAVSLLHALQPLPPLAPIFGELGLLNVEVGNGPLGRRLLETAVETARDTGDEYALSVYIAAQATIA